MKQRNKRFMAGMAATAVLVAAGCGGSDDSASTTAGGTTDTTEAMTDETDAPADSTDDSASTTEAMMEECSEADSVKLQLQWVVQAQFAGYYAAVDQGFYKDHCLDVEIVEGGVDIVPQTQLANGDVDFALSWVPKALASREAGANIVDIAQVFQRSGTLQVSFKDAGITSSADFAGKTIGNWGFGNEYEIFAALGKQGLDPASDVTLVGQDFSMNALLSGDVDAAEAMTYNEYAQVLEAENPDTGELYTADDLNVVSYEDEGVGMLQDAIWANGDKLESDPAYKDIATRFVAASLQGWIYCRDNAESCTDIVLAAGPTLGKSHQLWQMNEVNKLIWPSSNGVGMIDQAAWDRTAQIAQDTPNLDGATVLTAAPTEGAYTNDIVTAALAMLTDAGLDTTGESFSPIEVTLNAGGE